MSDIADKEPKSTGRKRSASCMEPLVVRPREAKEMLGGCSYDEIYRKIADGELESYLDGRRRLITVASIKADIARKVAAAASHGFEYAKGARKPRSP